jgi:hypothetical protein
MVLLQSSGVIYIFAILIYPLYQKSVDLPQEFVKVEDCLDKEAIGLPLLKKGRYR